MRGRWKKGVVRTARSLCKVISKKQKSMCISEKSLCHDYRGKSHLTYLIVFYHKMTGSADKERAVVSFTLTLARLVTLSPTVKHYDLDGWKTRWVKTAWMVGLREQWLMGRTLEAVNKWRVLGLSYLISLSMTGRRLWSALSPSF